MTGIAVLAIAVTVVAAFLFPIWAFAEAWDMERLGTVLPGFILLYGSGAVLFGLWVILEGKWAERIIPIAFVVWGILLVLWDIHVWNSLTDHMCVDTITQTFLRKDGYTSHDPNVVCHRDARYNQYKP